MQFKEFDWLIRMREFLGRFYINFSLVFHDFEARVFNKKIIPLALVGFPCWQRVSPLVSICLIVRDIC